jgi:HEAT repeat protein
MVFETVRLPAGSAPAVALRPRAEAFAATGTKAQRRIAMRLLNRAPLVLGISVSLLAPSLTSAPQSSQDRAWQIIKANLNEKDAEKRVIAVRVLGLLPGDPQAVSLAEQTAGDEKPAVRAAAATAMGQLHAKSSVDRLHVLLEDHEPSVALAAASALIAYKDDAAYDVYYEVLTGERKAHASLTQQAKTDLGDPKKLATLGFEQGIGFVPFAGIGWTAFQVLRKDDASPVRSAAARMLADDPDPDTGKALVKAASDNKSWLVRTAALEAIAKRGDAKLLDGVVPDLMDDNTSVRCTAAAAVIRLSTLTDLQHREG